MLRGSYCFVASFSFVLLLAVLGSFLYAPRDPKQCAMSYSRPEFIKQLALDTSWSRLAGKYSLYLYREGGIDISKQVDRKGQPVLFIPGHAGSYKQSRSIASETTVQFNELLKRSGRQGQQAKLDFFALDYNEELSAIHGPTLLSQAEYANDAIRHILSLYENSTSIMVVGHSMGGIIARIIPTIPSFKDNRLNTIITLSSPHSTPPAPVDKTIANLYRDVNRFWSQELPDGVLKEIAVLSIAGGNLDKIVASDSSSLHGLVPPSHGFTVYSTGIPHVWTGADHMAILWCNQLVQRVATAIIRIVDQKNPSTIKSVNARISIFKRIFLSRLEDINSKYVIGSATSMDFDSVSANMFDSPQAFIPFHSGDQPTHMPLVFKTHTLPTADFQLVTTLQITTNKLKVSLCKHQAGSDALACNSVTANSASLPAAVNMSVFNMTSLRIASKYLMDSDYVVVDVQNQPTEGFIKVEFQTSAEQSVVLNYTVLDLVFRQRTFEFPRVESGAAHFPNLNNPLFRYKLSITRPTGPECTSDDASSIIRMTTNNRYESKYFTDTSRSIDIAFHGESAFSMGQQLIDRKRGLQLQVWKQPHCGVLRASLKVDMLSSLGRILLQHGIALAVLPFAFATWVFCYQLAEFNATQIMPSWTFVAERQYFRFIMLGSTMFVGIALIYSQNGNSAQTVAVKKLTFNMLDLKLLGLGETGPEVWWPSLILPIISVGLLAFVVLVLDFIVSIASRTLKVMQGQRGAKPTLPPVDRSQTIWTTTTIFLCGFILPQVLFMVLFLVQLFFCSEALSASTLTNTRHDHNRYHYQFSILIILFCLVPYNAPASLVWIQDLVRGWYEPPFLSSLPETLQLAILAAYLTRLRTGGMTVPKMAYTNGPRLGFVVSLYCFVFGIGSAYTMLWVASGLWTICLIQAKTKQD